MTDERDGLLSFLDQQRYLLRLTVHGLTDEQAGMAPSVSSLSVGGLVKHLAGVERRWVEILRETREETTLEERAAKFRKEFRFAPPDTLAGALADYAAACRETDEVIAGIEDLGWPVPIPGDMPWVPEGSKEWSVRWVLLHLIQETARHVGHADIVRESVDGATALPLMAAAEDWPAEGWVKPWQPNA